MATARPIPFIGPPTQRATGTGDQRYVNVLFEIIKNETVGEQTVNCIKRPGLLNSTQPPAAAATGRGLYLWDHTGKIYTVFANKIWSNTTDLGVTLAASSGRVWFTETPASSSARLLIVSDGTDNYNITNADVITQIDEVDDADYPTNNLGPILYMDGYLFQPRSNGQLWNSDLNDFDSWTAASFLNVDTHGGGLEAIHILKDQIVALTKNRIEFFFNNGNPTGSPLLRIDQNTLFTGLAAKNSLAWAGDIMIFVAENSSGGDGGRFVMMISPGQAKDISSDSAIPINRFLSLELQTIGTCTAWMERVAGHLIYVLNLDLSERTFVYHVDSGLWCEWEIAAGGAKFDGIAATSNSGEIYIQNATNGRVHVLGTTTFQDSAANFTVTLQPGRTNGGSQNRKFESGISIIGDTTTGSVAYSYSDNDGTTFNTARNIDMTTARKRLTRCGSFYNRIRRFTYTQNAAFRVQAFVPEIDVGS